MAGFFGDSWEDPKSQAIMALAGGLMGGDWKKGLLDYGSTMSASKEVDFKKKLQQAQMDKYAADTDLDKQKLLIEQGKAKRTGEMDAMLMGLLGGREAPVATPNMQVTGMPESGTSPTGVQGRANPFAGVDKTALMLDYMQNGGKNMGGWVNDATKPKWENINGNLVNTNAQGFTGGFQAGMKASDNGQVSMWQPDGQGGITVGAPRGALDTFRAYKNVEAGVKNNNETTDYIPPGGNPIRMTKQQELGLINGGQPPQPRPMPAPMGQRSQAPAGSEASIIANGIGGLNGLPKTAPGGNVSFKSTPAEMDSSRIWQGALSEATDSFVLAQKSGDTKGMQRAQSDIDGIRREIGGGRPSLAPTQASAPSFGLPLQPQQEKDNAKIVNENVGKVNDVFLTSVYKPLIESKGAMASTIDSINQSRNAVKALGGTGWGTETKASAANVLVGLGIGGKNAEMYATNAQSFQQAAATQLQAGLTLQKGVQTKDDAIREAGKYAQLKNTPQANAYIFDASQAVAERELMKARFYESALPIASKKGDLQEVDREWNKRAPALFSMPTMKKWAN